MNDVFDKIKVYVLTVGYKDYAFYTEKEALEAFRVLSCGYDLENSWRTHQNYVDEALEPSLKVKSVAYKRDVLEAEENIKKLELEAKEKEVE